MQELQRDANEAPVEVTRPPAVRGLHEPVDSLDTIRWEHLEVPGSARETASVAPPAEVPAVAAAAPPSPPPVPPTRKVAPPPVPSVDRRTTGMPAAFPFQVLSDEDLPPVDDEPPLEGEDELALLLGGMQARERRKERPQSVQTPWFEDIFDETWLQLRPLGDVARGEREAAFLLGEMGENASTVLDVGCGHGRHLLPLAQAGRNVTGLDLSRPLLRRAWGQAQRARVRERITLWQGDMRRLSAVRQSFDFVFAWESTFGFFEDRVNFELLQSLRQVVRPGGRLVLDVLNRDWVIGTLPRKLWWERGDLLVLEDVSLDLRRSRVAVERTIVDENEDQWKQSYSVRLYSLHELAGMLAVAGFDVVRVSGHPASRGAFFPTHSRALIVTAERRSEG